MSLEEKLDDIHLGVSQAFASLRTIPVTYRLNQLKALKTALGTMKEEMNNALLADLNRSHTNSRLTETDMVIDMATHAIANLRRWTRSEAREIPPLFFPATAEVDYQPYGRALIVGSWNFPFDVTFGPLIDAISAGNAAVIKPSELAPASADMIEKVITSSLDKECYQVVQGGADTVTYLLTKRWDVICFTGSATKGKLVAAAAAKYMTPVILELGGKNPVVVDETADLRNAALRIAQGRFTNAGQMCISPEYVMVHKSIEAQFSSILQQTITHFYGSDPKLSPDLGRIVSEPAAQRIAQLLTSHNGETLLTSPSAPDERYISPTLIKNPAISSPLMQQEVFGPVLVLLTYTEFSECIEFINARERPLAVYYFGSDSRHFAELRNNTFSGAVVQNETGFHFGVFDLPFGGVGESGMGKTHGEYGFKAFSNAKGVYRKDTNNSYPVSLRYPPYTIPGEQTFFRWKSLFNCLFGIIRCRTFRCLRRHFFLLIAILLWLSEPKTNLARRLLSISGLGK